MFTGYHPFQVSTFAVNYKGKPYMEGLSANKGLLITLGKVHVVRWEGGRGKVGRAMTRDRAMPLTRHRPPLSLVPHPKQVAPPSPSPVSPLAAWPASPSTLSWCHCLRRSCGRTSWG